VEDATRLMMRGFFDQVMRYIPDEILREQLWQAVDQAMGDSQKDQPSAQTTR
jgi:hypothetical protein